MSLSRRIYHTLVPEKLRHRIYYSKVHAEEKKLVNRIISFLESDSGFPEKDRTEILQFLKTKGLHVFPYQFTSKYKPEDVEVFSDETCGLNYVLYSGKRLYLKRNWSVSDIKTKFSFLLNEQDPESPHQYLSEGFDVPRGAVLADIGAAEGIFTLPLIDKVSHAYLFETDEEWIEALNQTFRDFTHKVTVVNKFVSDENSEKHVSLDEFFKDKKADFLKIDVDGAEDSLLRGARIILSSSMPLKVAICTYHKQSDERRFSELMHSYGFKTSTSDKFMLFYFDEEFKEPFLRRGILRCEKS